MLDKRLQTIADTVRRDRRVADIGTDHAYLPVALVQAGITPFAIACDLREGPLENARRAVREAGLTERIDCRLGDGLAPIKQGEAEEIVIAGMGGETIAAILEACPWSKTAGIHYIFQPMTRSEDLRRYLLTNGYTILAETTLNQNGRLYVIVEAEWTDAPSVSEESDYLLGKLDGARDREWLLHQKNVLTKRIDGLTKAGEQDEVTHLTAILHKLEERL